MASRREPSTPSGRHRPASSAIFPSSAQSHDTPTQSSAQFSSSRVDSSRRPRSSTSTASNADNQKIICAVSESRGVSPTVGLAFVNTTTGEAVLSQLCDSQSYVRTIHKLAVFDPTQILIMSTVVSPKRSELRAIIQENLAGTPLITLDRKYWSESTGLQYVQQLAFVEDVEAIKVAIDGNYYATCCLAAVLKYIELALSLSFALHSLRITFQPPEGSMMIDPSTIRSLELIQNLHDARSKECLFGLLNETLTPMGARLLRNNILQPLTDTEVLSGRYDALDELTTKEDMFFATRQVLKGIQDVDKLLTALITIPKTPTIQHSEQAINNLILLKHIVQSINPVFEALTSARSHLLISIRKLCDPRNIAPIQKLIQDNVNEDVTYQSLPLDLRNQRVYAVKSGVNGLLDVARQTFKEATSDVYELTQTLRVEHDLDLHLKFENGRQFYLHVASSEIEKRPLPPVFINIFPKKHMVECQTLDLMKRNQRIADCHAEVMLCSDQLIHSLTEQIRGHIAVLFRISDGLAMLDMLASFGHLITLRSYTRPEFTDTLAIKRGRHPIREKIHFDRHVPNDVYSTQQSRFQIITGCNMSGKSTYIRSTALMTIMAQIGSFVPAQYASFPIVRQLFARVSMDDSLHTNVSTFAAEMRETAFILRNIDRHSMVVIDELGRGTSARDGLAIALAVAEALIDSKALVWFVTHFLDLAEILSERPGVVNLHLAVEMANAHSITMLYRVSDGCVREQHYGLTLARVVDLPPSVLEIGERVSALMSERIASRKRSAGALAVAKRRRLLLALQESLVQAQNGRLEGAELTDCLRRLQLDFVVRMSSIDALDENLEKTRDHIRESDPSLPSSQASGEVIRSSYFADSSSAKRPSHENISSKVETPSSDWNSTVADEPDPQYLMSGALMTNMSDTGEDNPLTLNTDEEISRFSVEPVSPSLQTTHQQSHVSSTTTIPRLAFDALQGRWNLNRRLTSALASYPSGTFTGTAHFKSRDPTSSSHSSEYLYIESGILTLSAGGSPIQCSRRYIYRFDESANEMSKWFVKHEDDYTADYLFYKLDFMQRLHDQVSTDRQARGYHLCDKDEYEAEYQFEFEEEHINRFRLKYKVKGPKKDYAAEAEYTRGAPAN